MAKQQDVLVTDPNLLRRADRGPTAVDQNQQQSEPKEPKAMPKYSATRSVRAVKLKAVDRNPDGVVVLVPEDSAFAPIQLGGNEAANVKGFGPSDPNKDYGYAVIDDNGRREWMSSADFEMYFGKK